jgi:hypothetical protein
MEEDARAMTENEAILCTTLNLTVSILYGTHQVPLR